MHDPGVVDGGECGGHTEGDAVQVAPGDRSVSPDEVGQAGTFDVFDDQVRGVMIYVGVEQLGGAEWRNLARSFDLAEESGAEYSVIGEVRLHDLDRNSMAGRPLTQIDGAHAAFTEAPEQTVNAESLWITRA
ncbi:hypothetical protein Acsp02_17040 [Actinoplanes sp. NBRC 103695]|nr:hypothetical protein Acsp02_17040 [Actinoplanes sp. NBRC 103695]